MSNTSDSLIAETDAAGQHALNSFKQLRQCNDAIYNQSSQLHSAIAKVMAFDSNVRKEAHFGIGEIQRLRQENAYLRALVADLMRGAT